ncbi:hypothetical protein LTR17_023954 [Elasticomyces elasticus]|nr:hypothetical protein LTR17_023954 [Elasticomyces elasticus]
MTADNAEQSGHDGMPEIDPKDPPNPLNDADKKILSTPDDQWNPITWDELREIITTNTLEKLIRSPAETRKYLAWSASIKEEYGATTQFVIKEKLRWTPEEGDPPRFSHKSNTPFADKADYAILKNDWPYSFEDGVVHLLVWTKAKVETDDDKGDVTPASRKLIEEYVKREFTDELGEGGAERVQWFKNWVSLQSVRALDHVHVMIKDCPPELLEKWLKRVDLE